MTQESPRAPREDLFAADVALLVRLQDAVLEESGAGDVLVAARELLGAVGDASDSARLVDVTRHLSSEDLEQVARALTVHFHLVNLAEERHRVRAFLAGEGGAGSDPWPSLSRRRSIPRPSSGCASTR